MQFFPSDVGGLIKLAITPLILRLEGWNYNILTGNWILHKMQPFFHAHDFSNILLFTAKLRVFLVEPRTFLLTQHFFIRKIFSMITSLGPEWLELKSESLPTRWYNLRLQSEPKYSDGGKIKMYTKFIVRNWPFFRQIRVERVNKTKDFFFLSSFLG